MSALSSDALRSYRGLPSRRTRLLGSMPASPWSTSRRPGWTRPTTRSSRSRQSRSPTGGSVWTTPATSSFARITCLTGTRIRIHGLREADLEEAKPLDEVLDTLIEALAGRVLVAHVAAVERGFLGAALSTVGEKLRNPIVDTAALDQELRRLRGQPAASGDPVGLSEMARALGLPVHRPHEADGDALTTAQAFIALATHLYEFELQTVGSLRRLEDATTRPGLVSRFLAILQRRGGSARP